MKSWKYRSRKNDGQLRRGRWGHRAAGPVLEMILPRSKGKNLASTNTEGGCYIADSCFKLYIWSCGKFFFGTLGEICITV